MHPTSHSSFVPDLDMNPPPAWSKPASALGLNNPLSHLPQSQQIRQLQEQIQQHRRLQHQQSHGYGLGGHSMKKKNSQNTASGANNNGNNNSNNNSNSNKGNTGTSSSNSGIAKTSTTNTDQDRSSAFQLQGHQHINIMNTDDMSGDEDIEEDDEDDEDDDKSDDRSNQSSHHRNASHPQLTQGFAIPGGFASFAPSSPLSPSSPGSIASDSSSMTSSMLSPGLLSTSTSGYPHHQQQHSHGHGSGSGGSIHGIETSLASLASLTVISPSSGGSSSATSVPMSMPNASRGRNIFSPHQTNPLDSTSPTTSSFQPQSLPMMYQGHGNAFMTTPTVTGGQTPSFSAFSSALTHHLQKQQQQQQQQMTSGTMSSSLPTHTNFNPFHQPPSQQPSQPQSPQMQHQPLSRSRSKSLTIPAPRIIPPLRALPPRPLQASAPRKYHGRQTRKQANSPLPPKEPVDPTRRVAHIISEQKRREKINGGFDELKSVIPECAQNTDSKATILRKAVDYIISLEDELRKYVELYQLETGSNPESSLEDHERER